jgi:hypothetical protein
MNESGMVLYACRGAVGTGTGVDGLDAIEEEKECRATTTRTTFQKHDLIGGDAVRPTTARVHDVQ